ITLCPRGRLDTADRLWPLPDQDGMVKATLTGTRGDGSRLCVCRGSQAVIDGEDRTIIRRETVRAKPIGKQHHEGCAVAAPRDGKRGTVRGATFEYTP